MSRPRHIRDAQRDREAARAYRHAMLDKEDVVLRRDAAVEIRRRHIEQEAQSPAERDAATRRLFEKWGGPVALALLIVGPLLADVADLAARSLT